MQTLICKENQVKTEVVVDHPVQCKTDPAKAGQWFVMLMSKSFYGENHRAFIDFDSNGTFISYGLIDEISGMTVFASPENFTEPFKKFIRNCIDEAMTKRSFLEKVKSGTSVG